MKNLLHKLSDLFFPEADRCPFCGKEGGFCATCRTALCEQRIDDPLAAFRYAGLVKELIHRLKFGGAAYLAAPMADLMEECMQLSGDFMTCVPLHPKRLRKRGYNQSELIAKRLAALSGIPYRPMLVKTRDTLPQSLMKNHEARCDNIRDAFRLSPRIPAISGKRILLVDDVFTTGATAAECVALLTDAGAESVRIITFAKGGSSWQPQKHCSNEH